MLHVKCKFHVATIEMQQHFQQSNEINIEFASDKYALDDIIDDSQG